MSNLKDKLYNLGVAPPKQAWDKIAAELDESHLSREFPTRLFDSTIVPPAGTWEKIALELEAGHYPARMYNMELPPPAGTFERVIHSLNSRTVAQVRKITPVFRYAAAILIIVAAYAIIRFAIDPQGSESNKNDMASALKDTPATGNNKTADTGSNTNVNNFAGGDEKEETLQSNTVIAKSAQSARKATHKVLPAAQVNTEDNEIANELSQSIYAYNDHIPDIADRYVMLMTPDGNIIRMSKKWSDLLCCVSGEEQDPDCKDQLKKWQQKIASSPLAPSPGNFMDILVLVNSLD